MQESEKDILWLEAHERSLAAASGSKTAGQGAKSIGSVSLPYVSARSRHNKKQHQLYQKRLKAKKAVEEAS